MFMVHGDAYMALIELRNVIPEVIMGLAGESDS